MYSRKRTCKNYKNFDSGIISTYQNNAGPSNCKDCVYFSSRNCGMDAANEIDPPLDLLL